MKRFVLNVDDIHDELFNAMLIVADVGNNHRATIEAETPSEAARQLTMRLLPFFTRNFYEADENGYPIEWSEKPRST